MPYGIIVPSPDVEPALSAKAVKDAESSGVPYVMMPPEAALAHCRWEHVSRYFSDSLPHMRAQLRTLMQALPQVHVVIGNDVGTLYGAYYALLEKKHVVVSFTSDADFNRSAFTQRYRPLLARLRAMIVAHAESAHSEQAEGKTAPFRYAIPLIDGGIGRNRASRT